VGNNIKKREILEKKQQYVTETLTQLLLKLGEEDVEDNCLKDDVHVVTTAENNSQSILESNEDAKQQYLSNCLVENDDTYTGECLESGNTATFTGITENENEVFVDVCLNEDDCLNEDVCLNEDDGKQEDSVNNECKYEDVLQTNLNTVFEEERINDEPIKDDESIKNDELNEDDELKEEEPIKEQFLEEDEELFEIQIGVTTYATDNEINGTIYALVDDGDVGNKVGYFKDGKAFFQ